MHLAAFYPAFFENRAERNTAKQAISSYLHIDGLREKRYG